MRWPPHLPTAREGGLKVRQIDLAALAFDPNVRTASPCQQELEEDLLNARDLILWAEHLVFVYPIWWGTMPALLKGFLDRVLTEGFSFRNCEGGSGYQGLLRGRSAQLITTMDTPPLVYRFIYRQPGRNAMARATLGFCGIAPVRSLAFGPVKDSAPAQRQQWLARARHQGSRLRRGRVTLAQRAGLKALAWLAALRLQFYPMSWMAYTMGALAAEPAGGVWRSALFWVGYLCLFLLEVAAVLTNELVDFETDRKNQFFGPFTGGSRVLVNRSLSRQEVRTGILLALLGLAACTVWLLWLRPPASFEALAVLGVVTVLAIGYTAPPLKLCYRGLGEFGVALTHSIGVILCGYVFLGGLWRDPLPWLLSVPLLLAIVPSIIVSGVPDMAADEETGKNTLAVRLGQRGALILAMVFTALATGAALLWQLMGLAKGAYAGVAGAAIAHGSLLVWLLYRRLRSRKPPGRLDGLMVASLTFLLWFGVIPLWRLAG